MRRAAVFALAALGACGSLEPATEVPTDTPMIRPSAGQFTGPNGRLYILGRPPKVPTAPQVFPSEGDGSDKPQPN